MGLKKTMKGWKKKKGYPTLFREAAVISIIFLTMGCVSQEKVEPLPKVISKNLIKNIEIVDGDEGERIIIEGESPLIYCSFKFIPESLELVVDIPGTNLAGNVPTTIAVGDRAIKDIVITQQEGNTQISIALNKLIRYQIKREDNVLSIDIRKPGPFLANEEREKREIKIVEKPYPLVKEDKKKKEMEIVKEVFPLPKEEDKKNKTEIIEKIPPPAHEEKQREIEIVEKVPMAVKEKSSTKELSPAQSLIDIFVDKSQKDKVILTLKADGRLGDYNTFNLAKPTRLVIDLCNIKRKFPQKTLLVGSPYLEKVRLGDSAEKVRLVLDFLTEFPPSYRIARFNDELRIVLGKDVHYEEP